MGASSGVMRTKIFQQRLKSEAFTRKKARCVRHTPLSFILWPAANLLRLLTGEIIQNN